MRHNIATWIWRAEATLLVVCFVVTLSHVGLFLLLKWAIFLARWLTGPLDQPLVHLPLAHVLIWCVLVGASLVAAGFAVFAVYRWMRRGLQNPPLRRGRYGA